MGSYPDELPVKGTIYAFMDLEPWVRNRQYHIFGAALIMTALLKLPWLQSFLSRKPLVLLGKISFSLYLLHTIIMGSLGNHLFALFTQHVSYLAAFIMTFSITLPVIFIASYLAYRYVDAPSVRVSQWAYDHALAFTRRIDRPVLIPAFMRKRPGQINAPLKDIPPVTTPAGQGSEQER
jgi:peptidoglycan/LPS O-acetylase OafA/YrhL